MSLHVEALDDEDWEINDLSAAIERRNAAIASKSPSLKSSGSRSKKSEGGGGRRRERTPARETPLPHAKSPSGSQSNTSMHTDEERNGRPAPSSLRRSSAERARSRSVTSKSVSDTGDGKSRKPSAPAAAAGEVTERSSAQAEVALLRGGSSSGERAKRQDRPSSRARSSDGSKRSRESRRTAVVDEHRLVADDEQDAEAYLSLSESISVTQSADDGSDSASSSVPSALLLSSVATGDHDRTTAAAPAVGGSNGQHSSLPARHSSVPVRDARLAAEEAREAMARSQSMDVAPQSRKGSGRSAGTERARFARSASFTEPSRTGLRKSGSSSGKTTTSVSGGAHHARPPPPPSSPLPPPPQQKAAASSPSSSTVVSAVRKGQEAAATQSGRGRSRDEPPRLVSNVGLVYSMRSSGLPVRRYAPPDASNWPPSEVSLSAAVLEDMCALSTDGIESFNEVWGRLMQRSLALTPSSGVAGGEYNRNAAVDTLRLLRNNFRPVADYEYVPHTPSHTWHGVSALPPRVLANLCLTAANVLALEPRLHRMSSPVHILGDLHGNFRDLQVFEKALFPIGMDMSSSSFLFLGDYVDRGPHGVEVVAFLLAHKLLAGDAWTERSVWRVNASSGRKERVLVRERSPKCVLLRGNHEVAELNGHERAYRAGSFRTQCKQAYGDDTGERVWRCFNEVFRFLPLAAVVDDTIFCVHGGIPRCVAPQENVLDVIEHFEDMRPCSWTSPLVMDLLWADPASPEEEQTLVTQKKQPDGRQLEHASDGDGAGGAAARNLLREEDAATTDALAPMLANGAGDGGAAAAGELSLAVQFPVGFGPNNKRGAFTCIFGAAAIEQFFAATGCTHIVRAHQPPQLGVDLARASSVITVFSSSHYCGSHNAAACVLVAQRELKVILLNVEHETLEQVALRGAESV